MGTFARLRAAGVKTALALSLALSLQPGWIGGNEAHAEGPSDPAPSIEAKVVNEHAGKKILFDNTHGQTSGAADWVIDGGFSDFGNALAEDGFDVQELRKSGPFTYSDLSNYDVFVIAEPNIPFKTTEQAAMEQYVKSGGSIFFIGDHYNADRNKNRWDGSESINGYRRGAWDDPAKGMSTEERNSAAMQGVTSSDWLAANFGIRFRYNALGDINANNIVSPEQSFGITKGVSNVAMHAGSTLAIVDPAKAKGIVYLPQTSEAWGSAVDQGVYNGGGIAEGPYAAVAKVQKGKAAFIGDSSPVEDATPKYLREETGARKTTYDGFKEQDDAKLLVQMVDWLADKEDYTDFTQVPNLKLDAATKLLPMETPQTSTEPQAEPWSAPAAGYKWYDASTFKPGSYGGPAAAANAAYGFVKQAQLPSSEVFQIRVTADQLAANATLGGFSAGIYTAGGTQVAQIQNSDGTWPSAYGYSQTFSLTADSKGHAYKDLTVRMKPGTEGAANLRLRQNGSNLLTTAVTIANVPAEPLTEAGNPVPVQVSIAEARSKAEGTLVTVEGVVTTEPGAFGGQAFYLQDESGGIYVYQSQSGFHQGDRIKVTASLALYNTEMELTDPVSVEKTGTAPLPEAVAAEAVTGSNQGQLIQLTGVTISNVVGATPAGSFEFDAAADNGTISHIRVDARTGFTQSAFAFQAGDKVDITGVASIFKGAYQLKPRGSADIAAHETSEPPVTDPAASGAPAAAVLSSDNGYDTGLLDGVYNIKLNLWWGNNASQVKLYENGALISTQNLKAASPSAQSTVFPVTGKSNGTYTYTAELVNAFGTTKTAPLSLEVRDANPAKPVLSHDNWDGDGSYVVSAHLWWGTNAASYKLYENDQLIDTQALAAATPSAQQAQTAISGRKPGEYMYRAEFVNEAGTTSSETLVVKVSR
ncbi:DUF5689 domain-containing protein [Paenibacillus sp. JX-17]|uniref:DUF5689 domain-containing protein n=1 Tax=Paenibacillus lacisoli TaxID=3064525 RepID=A0ABT9CD51_9BACL|nr:DUF5689 domain-containing protein [Paenibacillus sp. JX-17]MDO7905606.1 DUF5689 domain-containing protein [Paenibacillus sp. JX-17]